MSEAVSAFRVEWLWQSPRLRSLKSLLPCDYCVLTLVFSMPRRPCHYRLCGITWESSCFQASYICNRKQPSVPTGAGPALPGFTLRMGIIIISVVVQPSRLTIHSGGGLSHHYPPWCSAQYMTNRTVRWGLFLSKDRFRAFMQPMFILNVPQL